MSKFTDLINRINEWRDSFMTEERKKDLQSVLAAGKKVVAKLKKYHNDKIVSYDGADAYYSDIEENISDVVEPAGETDFAQEPSLGEKTFGYYEKIMNKGTAFPVIHYNYALCLEKAERLEDAIDELNEALRYNFSHIASVSKESVEEKLASLEDKIQKAK